MRSAAQAALLTGLFGTGKTTVAADIADLLEDAGVPYAALDLDWLTWTNAGGSTRADEHQMMLLNLKPIMSNYIDAGVTHFVLARSVQTQHELASIEAAIGMPMRTVELEVPLDEISRRIVADPTDGRRADLARTGLWTAQSLGTGFSDITVANDRSVRDVAIGILQWLEWSSAFS